jgi:hypothetical protein
MLPSLRDSDWVVGFWHTESREPLLFPVLQLPLDYFGCLQDPVHSLFGGFFLFGYSCGQGFGCFLPIWDRWLVQPLADDSRELCYFILSLC